MTSMFARKTPEQSGPIQNIQLVAHLEYHERVREHGERRAKQQRVYPFVFFGVFVFFVSWYFGLALEWKLLKD